MDKHVFLIGGRASGKTTLAASLANALGTSFDDTDHLLQREIGESIAELVAREGWPEFRARETQTLKGVLEGPPMVVACGGGIILAEENRRLLSKGVVLYLSAPPETLAARLAADPNEAQRPSLTGKSIFDEVVQVMREREPLYREVADAVIRVDMPIEDVLAAALKALRELEKAEG